jgi:hypothetical protein
MAAPNASLNRDSSVRRTASTSSEVVNHVDEEDDVQVLQCTSSRCKIKIPGPDGWVRKSSLDFYDEGDPGFDISISLPTPPTPGPSLPYGPDTCRDGFVWRDAIPGDHVCVTPDRRSTAASENAVAGARVDPLGAYGPNTCLAGYVWRDAYSGDVVCVTPDRRNQVHDENAAGPAHRVI